jgi:hypothetical protein
MLPCLVSPRTRCLSLSTALVLLVLLPPSVRRAAAEGGKPGSGRGVSNGVEGGAQIEGGKGLNAFQAMLWKYTARCALPEGETLETPPGPTGKRLKFPGALGAAPEWNHGPCDRACQEKVSSCLIALTNRTGKHVVLSLLGADPALGKGFAPNEADRPFPHQEGVFFGNVFSNEAYACQGVGVAKAAQVKRFCALEPSTCSGLPDFTNVGRCQDACTLECSRLGDGSERCVASSCKDPKGRRWDHPITVYLRNQIEAANADAMTGVVARDDGIDGLDAGDSATYARVDLTHPSGSAQTFVATFASLRGSGRLEIWLDHKTRVGVLDLPARASGAASERATTVSTDGVTGAHEVTLKVVSGKNLGRLSLIEFR